MKNNLSILVIDDEAPLEEIYTKFLAKIDAKVTFCNHPQKGWQAIDKDEYDLIITDLKMPIITGDEFIEIIRASKLNMHTPIILCSAFINKMVMNELTRESKIYFLSKPFDSKTLLELVSKVVGVKKSEQSENLALSEKWLEAFAKKLKPIDYEKIDQFDVWNFESISLNLFVQENNQQLSITLLVQQKTFLKIAGNIQGTKYKEIEPEILQVWQEFLEDIFPGAGRVTFSKSLSQEIITSPEHRGAFYKFNTTQGEILAYLN